MTAQVSPPHSRLDELVAELTQAAYPVALRHQQDGQWLDLELDLWQVLARTVEQWQGRALAPQAH
jgi:hypothetical protein